MITKPLFKPHLSSETALYILAFTLALSLRLFRLGAAPLTDFEASWALQAWDLVQGNKPALAAQPAYVILTDGLFYLSTGTNALARLIPALAGSLLVFWPWLFKRFSAQAPRLKRAGLLLAFFLALDPGLVVLSRTAGSPVTALSFCLLTLGLIVDRRPKLAGVTGALALLSGPALLEGLLGLGLAGLAAWLLNNAGWLNPPEPQQETQSTPQAFAWRQMFSFGAGAGLLVGTGLLWVPQGLGALAATFPAYLNGWITPSNIPILKILAALLFYQPLAILFGIVGTLSAWFHLSSRNPIDYVGRLLSLWAALALSAAVIYPGHQVFSAAWALVPLWGLASLALAGLFPENEEDFSLTAALGHAGLTALFLVLIGHNLLRLESLSGKMILYLAVVGGIFLMGLIVALLVTAGWSGKTALRGLSWGTGSVLLVLMLSFTWKATVLYPNGANELWSIGPAAGQLNELSGTVSDLSWRSKGQPYELDLIITSDAPSVRWAFRFFENAQYKPLVSSPATPSVIITSSSQQSLALPASYRGQDLVLRETSAWPGIIPANILRWVAFRQAPIARETVILWARNDLFPGGIAESQPATTAP